MRSVSGMLRLEMAQFRELEAFSQFGSDLDKATQFQLARGRRLVEIQKQGQYAPLPVENQILIIRAATTGCLDSIPVDAIARYERDLYAYFEKNHADLLSSIRETGEMSDDTKEEVTAALRKFGDEFSAAL